MTPFHAGSKKKKKKNDTNESIYKTETDSQTYVRKNEGKRRSGSLG